LSGPQILAKTIYDLSRYAGTKLRSVLLLSDMYQTHKFGRWTLVAQVLSGFSISSSKISSHVRCSDLRYSVSVSCSLRNKHLLSSAAAITAAATGLPLWTSVKVTAEISVHPSISGRARCHHNRPRWDY